jgi:hypothetical protein
MPLNSIYSERQDRTGSRNSISFVIVTLPFGNGAEKKVCV